MKLARDFQCSECGNTIFPVDKATERPPNMKVGLDVTAAIQLFEIKQCAHGHPRQLWAHIH